MSAPRVTGIRADAIRCMVRDSVPLHIMRSALARIDTKAKRRAIKADERALVFNKTGGLCVYCWTALTRHDCALPSHFHCDHVWSLARGGPDTMENLLPACAACNIAKGSRDLLDFYLGVRVA